MKGYMQFFDESGNHAAPFPDEYETFETLNEARGMFANWADNVGRYAEEQNASALVFIGEPIGLYPCDTYPDFSFYVGPRGGINRGAC